MGQVSINGKDYDIYGEWNTDTPGDPESAVTYFGGQLNASAWESASAVDQQKALVTASRIFDKQGWLGSPTDPSTPQPLAWPRTGVPDCDSIPTDPNEIPDNIVFGCYEEAAAILADAGVQTDPNSGSNLKRNLDRQKVGDLEVEVENEYFSPTNSGPSAATRFPTQVQEYIKCYLSSGGIGTVVEGATPSKFDTECFDFGVNSPGTL